MTRGMTHCRICGKPVPSIYRRNHETRTCRRMRALKGELPPIFRKMFAVAVEDAAQRKLEEFEAGAVALGGADKP